MPAVPQEVAEALSRFPEPVQKRLLTIREMIFEVARETDGVGPLTETLKWGEPAYLTEASKSGTTVRLGCSKEAPDDCAVFFNCKTSLVEEFRHSFPDVLRFEKNRAVIVPHHPPLPETALRLCIQAAFTYHQRKRKS